MAEGNPAIHAPGRLLSPFLVGEPKFHFAVIVDPLFHGSVARHLPSYL